MSGALFNTEEHPGSLPQKSWARAVEHAHCQGGAMCSAQCVSLHSSKPERVMSRGSLRKIKESGTFSIMLTLRKVVFYRTRIERRRQIKILSASSSAVASGAFLLGGAITCAIARRLQWGAVLCVKTVTVRCELSATADLTRDVVNWKLWTASPG
eukprot:1431950-Amphidinium_carterae.1